ncbi:MAG: hypothetical protein GVY33_09570 [Alphaproteobacteria bacterium]|jgi:uncharacterized membrane protein YqhA|nr:hypothetical protein [Alphaproteobacteria bacterium]
MAVGIGRRAPTPQLGRAAGDGRASSRAALVKRSVTGDHPVWTEAEEAGMRTLELERRVALAARLTTFVAVLASSVGAFLMIGIGVTETVMAARMLALPTQEGLPRGDAIAVHLISALDRFLMAVVLLYFAFGVYLLFVRPDRRSEELGIPHWLRVEGIGQLKQTLAEVIIVILFVLFLRVALESYIARGPELSWPAVLKLLILPVSIFLLSAALKLAELHPKKGEPRDSNKE